MILDILAVAAAVALIGLTALLGIFVTVVVGVSVKGAIKALRGRV